MFGYVKKNSWRIDLVSHHAQLCTWACRATVIRREQTKTNHWRACAYTRNMHVCASLYSWLGVNAPLYLRREGPILVELEVDRPYVIVPVSRDSWGARRKEQAHGRAAHGVGNRETVQGDPFQAGAGMRQQGGRKLSDARGAGRRARYGDATKTKHVNNPSKLPRFSSTIEQLKKQQP